MKLFFSISIFILTFFLSCSHNYSTLNKNSNIWIYLDANPIANTIEGRTNYVVYCSIIKYNSDGTSDDDAFNDSPIQVRSAKGNLKKASRGVR
jgi:hypothetical protein